MSADENTLYQWWLDYFIIRDMATPIKYIADNHPDTRSLEVAFNDIFSANTDLAEEILNQPQKTLNAGESAIASLLDPDQKVGINLKIRELFTRDRIMIRNLRAENLSKFIALEGIIRKATEVRPKLLFGVFKCNSCGFKQEIIQDAFSFTEPLECPKDEGGCGKRAGSTTFMFVIHESLFIDSQKVEIQEYPEGLRGGDQPQRISILLEDDMCGKISPGDRAMFTGLLKAKQRKEGQTKGTVFDLYLKGNCIERNDQVFEEMELTDEDETRIVELSRDADINNKILRSIAPTIYEMDRIKEALAIQLFGGIHKVYPDGSNGRGDIHILLVGDPGTAKSMLLKYMSDLSPRGIFTSGKSSSAAGLTAAVVKDEFGDGRYTLEAGVMVLADKGLACIDEMDKMNDTDRAAMHEAMEQQTVSIAKAGIQSTLQSRCSVLGAANPKGGRFRTDISTPIHDQITLQAPLRSRFDLIFLLIDKPDMENDRRLAGEIIKRHWMGEALISRREGKSIDTKDIDIDDLEFEKVSPEIETDLLRKYIAYAKKECFPILTLEAREEIVNFYVDLRESNQNSIIGERRQVSIPLTARQLEALVRIAEASARMRLSPEATEQDARFAIELMRFSLEQTARDEMGNIDIDGIFGSGSKTQMDTMLVVVDLIRSLESQSKEGIAKKSDLIERAKEVNLDPIDLENYLKKLREEGSIYEPKTNHYSFLR